MSLMRINHTLNEVERLQDVIEKLNINYESDFKEHDSHAETSADEIEYGTFAQFQNELILVKHVALIENMIINIFRGLVILRARKDYWEEYFDNEENFTDIFVSINKISELTNKEINIKKLKFWYFYEIMRTIRHTIAHGDPLFIMSYKRVNKFNSNINIIFPYSEKNEGSLRKFYPSLLNPTYSSKSKWHCHLANNLTSLVDLNKQCYDFSNDIRNLYLSFGYKNNYSKHEIYCPSWGELIKT